MNTPNEKFSSFIERLKHDADFRNRLNAESDSAGLVNLLKAEGYSFTLQEFGEALAALPTAGPVELSDSDMQQVAGGGIGDILGKAKDELVEEYKSCQVTSNPVVNHVLFNCKLALKTFAFMVAN